MKYRNALAKSDFLAIIACIVFLFANIAAVGPIGRSRAKEAACLSRLMKWGQVLQAYTAENNGFFHTRSIGNIAGLMRMWLWTYEPYYNDKEMLCCPAADNPYRNFDTFSTWGGPDWPSYEFGMWNPDDPDYCGPNPPYYGSYGFNRYILDMGGPYTSDTDYWRRAGYKCASQVPVIVDCMYVNLFYNHDDEPPAYEGDFSQNSGISLACVNRHNGGVNVCFMDFSARRVGLKELWTLKGNRNFDTCNEYTICGWGGDAEACADFWDSQAPWMSEFPEY